MKYINSPLFGKVKPGSSNQPGASHVGQTSQPKGQTPDGRDVDTGKSSNSRARGTRIKDQTKSLSDRALNVQYGVNQELKGIKSGHNHDLSKAFETSQKELKELQDEISRLQKEISGAQDAGEIPKELAGVLNEQLSDISDRFEEINNKMDSLSSPEASPSDRGNDAAELSEDQMPNLQDLQSLTKDLQSLTKDIDKLMSHIGNENIPTTLGERIKMTLIKGLETIGKLLHLVSETTKNDVRLVLEELKDMELTDDIETSRNQAVANLEVLAHYIETETPSDLQRVRAEAAFKGLQKNFETAVGQHTTFAEVSQETTLESRQVLTGIASSIAAEIQAVEASEKAEAEAEEKAIAALTTEEKLDILDRYVDKVNKGETIFAGQWLSAEAALKDLKQSNAEALTDALGSYGLTLSELNADTLSDIRAKIQNGQNQ